MERKNLETRPVFVAFTFDNADDRLLSMTGTYALEKSLALAVPECMQNAVLASRIRDMRVVVYEFPDSALIPEPSRENCESYYHDLLIPAADKLGTKPSVELHAQEVVFAMLHDLPIELNKPETCIRKRADYAEHCRSFRGGFIDLMGKGTTVVLPSGEEIDFGLKSAALQGIETKSAVKHKTPDKEVKSPKHRIH